MNRTQGITRLRNEQFDVLIVGGGASGLGCAVDAAARGYRTGLIEGGDFAQATSSRSTKLVHGGVRYLQQGRIALVREALHERASLLRNAPDLVHPLQFFIPAQNVAQLAYYAAGLRVYDSLAGGSDFPGSRIVREGVTYWDAQFDDARLALALAQTAVDHGAAVANYVRATGLLYKDAQVCGVRACDMENGTEFDLHARAVVNATGIFADDLRRMDDPACAPLLAFSRGSHIVLPQHAVPLGNRALLVPKTSDGRVLFGIPWHARVLVGTTDVAVSRAQMDPQPSRQEIAFLLETLNRYVPATVRTSEVSSAFAGLRPLLARPGSSSANLSREHLVLTASSGLVTIAGGKWTTYRKMAQDTIDTVALRFELPRVPSRTSGLMLARVPLTPAFEHAIDVEMARTVEDLLARRTRALFVDARAAIKQAPMAAALLAQRLGRDEAWAQEAARRFESAAARYIPA